MDLLYYKCEKNSRICLSGTFVFCENAYIMSQWHATATFCLTTAVSWRRWPKHGEFDCSGDTITRNRLTRAQKRVWSHKSNLIFKPNEKPSERFVTFESFVPFSSSLVSTRHLRKVDSLWVQTTMNWIVNSCFPWQLESSATVTVSTYFCHN